MRKVGVQNMYRLSYVEDDAARIEEFSETERTEALKRHSWTLSRPDITEVEFNVMTVDVTFTSNTSKGKVYTYTCEGNMSKYDYVDITPNLDEDDPDKTYVYIVFSGYRTDVELKKMAEDKHVKKFKPLHGEPGKFEE